MRELLHSKCPLVPKWLLFKRRLLLLLLRGIISFRDLLLFMRGWHLWRSSLCHQLRHLPQRKVQQPGRHIMHKLPQWTNLQCWLLLLLLYHLSRRPVPLWQQLLLLQRGLLLKLRVGLLQCVPRGHVEHKWERGLLQLRGRHFCQQQWQQLVQRV